MHRNVVSVLGGVNFGPVRSIGGDDPSSVRATYPDGLHWLGGSRAASDFVLRVARGFTVTALPQSALSALVAKVFSAVDQTGAVEIVDDSDIEAVSPERAGDQTGVIDRVGQDRDTSIGAVGVAP
jgi:hypothetical protein